MLAPDVLVELHNSDERSLLAFVELDLGTMSSTRLKVDTYATYAAHAVWSEHYEFCPCLLFLTTIEARTIGFLKTLAALLRKMANDGRGSRAEDISWFATAACANPNPQQGCEVRTPAQRVLPVDIGGGRTKPEHRVEALRRALADSR